MKFKHSLIVSLGLSMAALGNAQSAPVAEKESQWFVRFRLLNMKPANLSDAFPFGGGTVSADKVHVTNKTFPEVDFSYFFTKHISAELILTYPQQHEVIVNGGYAGTATHLPPTLLLQYRFDTSNPALKPYVGVGFNYTRFTSSNIQVGGVDLNLSQDSTGWAFQVGADYKIGKNLYLNLDYKHVDIGASVYAGTTYVTTARINPDLLSVGIGFHF